MPIQIMAPQHLKGGLACMSAFKLLNTNSFIKNIPLFIKNPKINELFTLLYKK